MKSRAWAVVLSVGLLAGCQSFQDPGGTAGSSTERCQAPTADELKALAKRSSLVVDGQVQREAQLTDGVTTSVGYVVQVESTRFGALPSGVPEIGVWSNLSSRPTRGRLMTFFLFPHQSQATTGGQPIPSYELHGSGAFFLSPDKRTATLSCKASESQPFDASLIQDALR